MYASRENTQDNQSKAIANSVGQKKDNNRENSIFVDNREIFTFSDNRTDSSQPFQKKINASLVNNTPSPSIQEKPNNTGLPHQLKSGIENLSGYSMDDVKVHYNSDKPAQLQSHAYAQGKDIHLASGQEKHLSHEAWHVVQKKQGRVKPTKQMKDKVNVNDDAGLEKEADVMGHIALSSGDIQLKQESSLIETSTSGLNSDPVQKYRIVGENMISESGKFTVAEHGKPESKMFVKSLGDVGKLDHIGFEQGGAKTIDEVGYTNLTPKYKSLEDKAQMEKMYCGKFAGHVTGKNETQESGDAPVGRNLFIDKPKGKGTAWSNHYAPVIIQDGGDRGTFETAVGLDFMFFGIYGQTLKQSFAFKTELAGMKLGVKMEADMVNFLLKEGKINESIAEETLSKSKDIIKQIGELENGNEEVLEGKTTSLEVRSLIEEIKAHQQKRYNLEQELEKEERAKQEEDDRQKQQEEIAKKKKEKVKKIAAITASIITVLGVILVIFF